MNPLVSCIMPTCNRRPFVPLAVEYFLRQDYPERELIVVDDGENPVSDLLPADPSIRYIRLERKRSVGVKRNLACQEARGALIMHWDDDDWYAPRRVRVQVEALLAGVLDVCGLRQMLFFDPAQNRSWLYEYPASARPWLAGGSLLYRKEVWQRSPFPDLPVGEDTRFVWGAGRRLLALPDYTMYVAMTHAANTSPRDTRGAYWKPWAGDIGQVLGADLTRYQDKAPIGLSPEDSVSLKGQPTEGNTSMDGIQEKIPTFSIIMVTHNALEMVRIATLRTLCHIAGQDARLVVVDNASEDGTQHWLELLHQRGAIDLIPSGGNIGHAPAIQLALERIRSPYIITLDSDAFPLADDWLTQLRARLVDRVKVAGIRHHRDYVHPSCLMIARQTLQDLKLDFLPRTVGGRRYDVAEYISAILKQRGYRISGLERSAAIQRGSLSEPVYLGSQYEGIIYHQWYTTRKANSAGQPVDDVPTAALETAFAALREENEKEQREINVIVGIRIGPDTPKRTRNCLAALRAFNLQDLERWRYRVIVIEQDSQPRAESLVAPYVDRYVFAYNPGPYNRSWAFNIGATLPGSQQGVLCMADSDLLVPSDFLSSLLSAVQNGARGVRPYTEFLYLDAPSTERILKDFEQQPMATRDPARYRGRLYQSSMGGSTCVEAGLYRQVGGHDERFSGWGAEDHEFFLRLSRQVEVISIARRLIHLEHELPEMSGPVVRANHQLFEKLLAGQEAAFAQPIGDQDRFRPQAIPPPAIPSRNGRDWQNWQTWDEERIRRIVNEERQLPQRVSIRYQLARLVSWLGSSLLDVGCSSGALWVHLERYRRKMSWVGVDITPRMVQVSRQLFPGTPASIADAADLPFNNGSFDTVLLRHILEHLPPGMMEKTLAEALRVARRAVLLDFQAPLLERGERQTTRIAENFLLTRWTAPEIAEQVKRVGWQVAERFGLCGRPGETDTVWILRPKQYLERYPARLKVSIIMPTYQRNHVIQKTVQQIQAQTHTNWELIVIDNARHGSYAFDDPRIHVFHHAERTSAAHARNQGLKYVTGDLVCFFDDDDDMFPDYLEKFCTAFESFPRLKMARCGMILPDGSINFSYATPECALRAEFATPTWRPYSLVQDQSYFQAIVSANQWSQENGDILLLNQATCRANNDPKGGARSGRY